MSKKNLRRVSFLVTTQTSKNLQRLAAMCGYRETGLVVDKLTREKMVSLHTQLPEKNFGGSEDMEDKIMWVSVHDRLPPEHDSIFKRLVAANKWSDAMFRTISDDVIVAVKFDDGTRKTGIARTKDGMWSGLPAIGRPVVTHWAFLPEAPIEKETRHAE